MLDVITVGVIMTLATVMFLYLLDVIFKDKSMMLTAILVVVVVMTIIALTIADQRFTRQMLDSNYCQGIGGWEKCGR